MKVDFRRDELVLRPEDAAEMVYMERLVGVIDRDPRPSSEDVAMVGYMHIEDGELVNIKIKRVVTTS